MEESLNAILGTVHLHEPDDGCVLSGARIRQRAEALASNYARSGRERSEPVPASTSRAGIAIDVIGFSPGASPGEVDPTVIFQLGLLDGPIAAIPALVSILFYARYRIDKTSHAETRATLATRARLAEQ